MITFNLRKIYSFLGTNQILQNHVSEKTWYELSMAFSVV